MREGLKSPNWSKRLRMSHFVQVGKMSFLNAKPDPLPETPGEKVFHILLKNGLFSKGKLVRTGFGGFIWSYPIHPVEFLGDEGVFLPSDVLAWQELV